MLRVEDLLKAYLPKAVFMLQAFMQHAVMLLCALPQLLCHLHFHPPPPYFIESRNMFLKVLCRK